MANVHAKIVGVSPGFPTEIVVGLNDRDPEYHDLYRIDVSTEDRALVQRNDDFAELLVDDDYRVRLGGRITPDGGSEMFALTDTESWQPFMKVEMEGLHDDGALRLRQAWQGSSSERQPRQRYGRYGHDRPGDRGGDCPGGGLPGRCK